MKERESLENRHFKVTKNRKMTNKNFTFLQLRYQFKIWEEEKDRERKEGNENFERIFIQINQIEVRKQKENDYLKRM
jgi:hypothetical protein